VNGPAKTDRSCLKIGTAPGELCYTRETIPGNCSQAAPAIMLIHWQKIMLMP